MNKFGIRLRRMVYARQLNRHSHCSLLLINY